MRRWAVAAVTAALSVCVQSARAAPPLVDYTKDWDTNFVRLSPSGALYAFVEKTSDKHRVVVTSPNGQSGQTFDVGSAYITGLSWAGEDHVIVYTRTLGKLGPGFTQKTAWMTFASVINLKTKTTLIVFNGHADKVGPMVEGAYGVSQIDGRWYGYFGGFDQKRQVTTRGPGSRTDLYQVDLDTGAIKMVSQGSDQGENWLVSPSGQVVARFEYEWANGRWQVLTGASGTKPLASGQSRLGGGGGLRLGRTADELLFARPADNEGPPAYQILPLSGAPAEAVPESDTVGGLIADRKTGLWIGSTTLEDSPHVRHFQPELEQKIQKVYRAFPDKTVDLASTSEDLRKLVAFTSGSGDSGTYYLVDLDTYKAAPIGYAFPTIEPKDVGPIRMMDYQTSDGLTVHAVLSLPPDRPAKNLPLVILPHDALVGRGHPTFHQTAQAFASRGYAVLEPDPRGSNGYGEEFVKAGAGQLGRKIQSDLSDGIAALAQGGAIDPKRVAIVGWGWGGYAALAGVTVQQGIYRCAVSVRGIADVGLAISNTETNTGGTNNGTRVIQRLAGANSPYSAETKAISPARQARHADAPILLILDKDDPLRSDTQSGSMYNALTSAGKTVETKVMSGLKDDGGTESDRLSTLEAAIAFIEKYNPANPPAGGGGA